MNNRSLRGLRSGREALAPGRAGPSSYPHLSPDLMAAGRDIDWSVGVYAGSRSDVGIQLASAGRDASGRMHRRQPALRKASERAVAGQGSPLVSSGVDVRCRPPALRA
ncbi:hypothetical protein GGR61_002674 [Xanthomonas arboricola]|nr:hypothetical protein [Xanthomonas sp. 3058]